MSSSLTANILLAQAVNVHGAESWSKTAEEMLSCRILPEDLRKQWTAPACEKAYKDLLSQYQLTADDAKPNTPTSRKLIELLYTARLRQILDALKENAKRVQQIKQFCDEAATGKHDDFIKNQATPEIQKQLQANEKAAADAEASAVAATAKQDEIVIAESPSSSNVDAGTPKARSSRRNQQRQEFATPSTPAAAATDEAAEAGAAGEETSRPVRASARKASTKDSKVDEAPVAASADEPKEQEAVEGENAAADEEEEGEDAEEEDAEVQEELLTTRSKVKGRRGSAQQGTSVAAASPSSTTKAPNRKKRKASEPPAATASPPTSRRKTAAASSTRGESAQAETEEEAQAKREKDAQRFRAEAKAVLERLTQVDVALNFKELVQRRSVPGYYTSIKSPLSIEGLRKRLSPKNANAISSWPQLSREFFLMCANAVQFNGPDSEVAQEARELASLYEQEAQRALASAMGDSMPGDH